MNGDFGRFPSVFSVETIENTPLNDGSKKSIPVKSSLRNLYFTFGPFRPILDRTQFGLLAVFESTVVLKL